jgi:hypothetical protein
MYLQLTAVFVIRHGTDKLFPYLKFTKSLHPILHSAIMTIFDISLLLDDNLKLLPASFIVETKNNLERGKK